MSQTHHAEPAADIGCGDAGVALGGHEQRGWTGEGFRDVVIRRVCTQPLEVFRVLRVAVLRDPEARDQEAVVTKHVEQGHADD